MTEIHANLNSEKKKKFQIFQIFVNLIFTKYKHNVSSKIYLSNRKASK